MSSKSWRLLLLFYAAMQQVASPQTATMSHGSDAVRRIQVLEDGGNLLAATELAERLVADLKRNEPTNRLLPEAVDRVASLQQDQGKYSDAERLYQSAVELWQRLPDSPNTGLATELNNLASLYSERGQFEKSEAARRHSLMLRLRLLGPTSSEVALVYSNLASDMFRQGNYHESEELAHQAIEIWLKGSPDKCQIDLAYNTLAMIQLHAVHYSLALKFVQLALETYHQHGGKDRARLAGYQHTLALAKEYTGDAKGAAQAFQDSLAMMAGANTTRSVRRVGLLKDDAALLRSMGAQTGGAQGAAAGLERIDATHEGQLLSVLG